MGYILVFIPTYYWPYLGLYPQLHYSPKYEKAFELIGIRLISQLRLVWLVHQAAQSWYHFLQMHFEGRQSLVREFSRSSSTTILSNPFSLTGGVAMNQTCEHLMNKKWMLVQWQMVWPQVVFSKLDHFSFFFHSWVFFLYPKMQLAFRSSLFFLMLLCMRGVKRTL